MQIYTKVLIGMAVGAAVGIFLGPKSEFLSKDTYKVTDASMVEIYRDLEDPASRIELPAGVTISFRRCSFLVIFLQLRICLLRLLCLTCSTRPRFVAGTAGCFRRD